MLIGQEIFKLSTIIMTDDWKLSQASYILSLTNFEQKVIKV